MHFKNYKRSVNTINIHPSQEIITLNLMAGFHTIICLPMVSYNFMDFEICTISNVFPSLYPIKSYYL